MGDRAAVPSFSSTPDETGAAGSAIRVVRPLECTDVRDAAGDTVVAAAAAADFLSRRILALAEDLMDALDLLELTEATVSDIDVADDDAEAADEVRELAPRDAVDLFDLDTTSFSDTLVLCFDLDVVVAAFFVGAAAVADCCFFC